MTKINEAKKVIRQALVDLGLPAHRLTARTISFSDLARDSCIFVTVHNWTPNKLATELKDHAHKHDFCVEFSTK